MYICIIEEIKREREKYQQGYLKRKGGGRFGGKKIPVINILKIFHD